MPPYLPLFRDADVGGSTQPLAAKDLHEGSDTSLEAEAAHEPLAWETSAKRRDSRRAWFLAIVITVALALFLMVQDIEGVAALRDMLLAGRVITNTDDSCVDPYLRPGLLWRSSNATMSRWLPYDDSPHPEPDETDFSTPGGNYSIDILPQSVLERAPPSLGLAMLDRNTPDRQAQALPRLEYLRGKRVALVGCSLDRYALVSMCNTLGAGTAELEVSRHGLSSCYFRDLDFVIEVWFHGGVRQGGNSFGENYKFERMMESAYIPRTREKGMTPHLIVLASGTWDQGWMQSAFGSTEDLTAQTATSPGHLTPVLPLEAYAYYQTRLRDEVRFLREHFPESSLMFRPESYQQRNTNAVIFSVREAAVAAMRSINVPLFTWAEKLVGEQDMADPTHYREGSAAYWLYSDMVLFYLRHYVEGRSHCESS